MLLMPGNELEILIYNVQVWKLAYGLILFVRMS